MRELLGPLVRWAYRKLVPGPIRNPIHLRLLLVEHDKVPESAPPPAARRVMVLAPHPDDESIGCGGSIRLHVEAGAQVSVVYITDGRRGDPRLNAADMPCAEKRVREDSLVERRRREAERAGKVLGIQRQIFLELPDAALEADPPSVAALAAVLRELVPEVLYAPFLADAHRDHWMTNVLLRRADASLGPLLSGSLYCGYEVWNPLPANRLVDITPVAETKRRAIEVYESQTAFIDYAATAMGLSAYRSMIHQKGRGFAEAFFACPWPAYRFLFDQVVAGAWAAGSSDGRRPVPGLSA